MCVVRLYRSSLVLGNSVMWLLYFNHLHLQFNMLLLVMLKRTQFFTLTQFCFKINIQFEFYIRENGHTLIRTLQIDSESNINVIGYCSIAICKWNCNLYVAYVCA